ncbi:MAG: L-threonylcarbamoyladenylate synthase [Alphaproteobacteria bacterium]
MSSKILQEAVETLRSGELIGLPTETVYGLACDATNGVAVAKIYQRKQRPSFNPLIIHVSDIAMAQEYGTFSSAALKLADHYWPGPVTMVVPGKGKVSELVSAGLETIGIRMPNHQVARHIIKDLGRPIAAPSANVSGFLSPTAADHVKQSFPDLLVLDGGPTDVGLESTIVDMSTAQPAILRAGVITEEQVEAVLGPLAAAAEGIKAPGQLLRHYATNLPLRMDADVPQKGEAFLGFGDGPATQNLSQSGDLLEAAANLFKMLHILDDSDKYAGIAVARIPDTGVGVAINDRLRRASERE